MKFGSSFKESIVPEWKFYYMDYDDLKRMIKERTTSGSFFEEGDEAAFVAKLESELQKVYDFRDVKFGELTRHVQHCENSFQSFAGSPNQIKELESEVERITEEVSKLSSFSRSNYTAFIKIIKKHDKHTEFMLKPMFMVRLNPRVQQGELLDSLLYRLSKLFDKVRRGPHGTEGPENVVSKDTGHFVRKTTKYWVHSDNVTEVKCAILRHLPVLVFPNPERKVDPGINSVYLDNDNLELYEGRIQKTENAEAIRLRWYGTTDNPENVFIERKTHKEDWTGDISVKERFCLKEKYVDEFITGSFKPENVAEKLQKHEPNIDQEELAKVKKLASEIQDRILISSLSPAVRTFYNRTAFQLPGDSTIRISLDTELCMINERQTRGSIRWKRSDLGPIVYPFENIPKNEIIRFPYAILEVKLNLQSEDSAPDWIAELTEGHLVQFLVSNLYVG